MKYTRGDVVCLRNDYLITSYLGNEHIYKLMECSGSTGNMSYDYIFISAFYFNIPIEYVEIFPNMPAEKLDPETMIKYHIEKNGTYYRMVILPEEKNVYYYVPINVHTLQLEWDKAQEHQIEKLVDSKLAEDKINEVISGEEIVGEICTMFLTPIKPVTTSEKTIKNIHEFDGSKTHSAALLTVYSLNIIIRLSKNTFLTIDSSKIKKF